MTTTKQNAEAFNIAFAELIVGRRNIGDLQNSTQAYIKQAKAAGDKLQQLHGYLVLTELEHFTGERQDLIKQVDFF